jgi:hypothetical protein
VADAHAGRRVDGAGFTLAAGPAADERMLRRMAFVNRSAAA